MTTYLGWTPPPVGFVTRAEHDARIADLERQLAEALAVGLKVALRNGDLTHQLAEAREAATSYQAALVEAGIDGSKGGTP